MQIGLVTYKPEHVEGYDLHVYYSKWADGQAFPAAIGMQNDVTVFCDAKAIREDPSIVQTSPYGEALRRNRRNNLPFDYICPTHPGYRAKVYQYLDSLSQQDISGVTLNLYHFADQDFCTCPRCTELHQKSGLDKTTWRAQTITNFIAEAKTHTKGTFAVEMFPDPVLAKERFGIDFDTIAKLVDYFHVPLSSRDYFTNYWVDTIVRDFTATLKKPVVVELSAEMPTDEKLEALLKTVAYISRHNLTATLFLVHDSENARQIARFAVHNNSFREWIDSYKFTKMQKIIDNWAKIY
ncbi:hypothetical protein [Candidatus Bathycorpusculum sp.]|uniref:hypothetical protein n=1 Tax=Candidatus Bathycorpusculum sp. TaxID=2994959 RepID=UPI0028259E92|nr:hypothetical protein [Candidatus Termitimicrobium sp.]